MANLAKMFGAKKAEPIESQPNEEPKKNETVAAPKPVSTPQVGKLGGMFGAKKVQAQSVSERVDQTNAKDSSVGGSASTGGGGLSLDDLDGFDVSDVEESRPKLSRFDDETPAQKPTRELPDGLTKQQLGFVDLIDGIYTILDDPELLGGVIRNIMIELQTNPDYMHLVAPEDVRTWIRAMRDSMGLARVKKMEKSTKRSAGGSKSKSKAVDDDMLSDLADLGIDLS